MTYEELDAMIDALNLVGLRCEQCAIVPAFGEMRRIYIGPGDPGIAACSDANACAYRCGIATRHGDRAANPLMRALSWRISA